MRELRRRALIGVSVTLGVVALGYAVGPPIVERSQAVTTAVDKDFEETKGVDIIWNPDTNVYSAVTRPSSGRAGSQQELMRGILQRVAKESGCDILSITYFSERASPIRDPNNPRDLYQIPVLCPSRNR